MFQAFPGKPINRNPPAKFAEEKPKAKPAPAKPAPAKPALAKPAQAKPVPAKLAAKAKSNETKPPEKKVEVVEPAVQIEGI